MRVVKISVSRALARTNRSKTKVIGLTGNGLVNCRGVHVSARTEPASSSTIDCEHRVGAVLLDLARQPGGLVRAGLFARPGRQRAQHSRPSSVRPARMQEVISARRRSARAVAALHVPAGRPRGIRPPRPERRGFRRGDFPMMSAGWHRPRPGDLFSSCRTPAHRMPLKAGRPPFRGCGCGFATPGSTDARPARRCLWRRPPAR
jgi:hypothetical protein